MDLYQGNNQSFFLRYIQEIKGALIILILLLFLALYKFLPPVQKLVDKPFDFAVAGISVGYSKLSTWIYQKTGKDLGLVHQAPDPEFLFQVRLASYVNESRPGPLLDIAVDARLPLEQRERALLALLKFDSTSQWIQPFLNELAKGGLPGLYDKDAPVMNELMQRIRAEGGIRQTLVRDYADSVLSFMLQHPKLILRQHALRWVNDLIAEEAIFLIVDRIDKEKDPETQVILEEALWNIRAVSDRSAAIKSIRPFYSAPPWKGVGAPLSYVLSRIGYEGANGQLRLVAQRGDMDQDLRSLVNIALTGKLFPKSLQISNQLQIEMASRMKARKNQVRWAMARQMMIRQEEANVKAQALALKKQKREATEFAAVTVKEVEKAEEAKRLAQEKEMRIVEEKERLAQEKLRKEAEARAVRAKQKEEARLASLKKAQEEAKAAQVKLAEARRKKTEEKQLARLEKEKKAKEEALKVAAAVPPVPQEEINFDPDAMALPTKQPLEMPESRKKEEMVKAEVKKEEPAKQEFKKEELKTETAFPEFDPEMPAKEPLDHGRTAQKPVDLVTVQTSGSQPTTPAVPSMKAFDNMEKKITVARLPTQEEIDAELARREEAKRKFAPKPSGQMASVNFIFEIKNQDVPLYVDPGFTKLTGVILPIGSKGQASFKVVVGDDEWYQVKSKKDTGWANGSLITVYELPSFAEPVKVAASIPSLKPGPPSLKSAKPKVEAQEEATYFEPVFQGAIVYRDPSDQADQVGTLEEGVPYLATQSQKIGRDRWFLLQLSSRKTGWVHGVDLQLAGDILPPPEEMLEPPPAPGEKWVAATDAGVPVYSRPSIVAKKMRSIAPGDSYKVVMEDEGGSSEWYKISLGGRKEGWVQSMFVKITKAGDKVTKKSASK